MKLAGCLLPNGQQVHFGWVFLFLVFGCTFEHAYVHIVACHIMIQYFQIPVRSGFGVFVTRRDGDKSSVLPSYMQELFRSFSLTLPPLSMVFRVHAALCGYKNPKQLADRLVMFYTLVREQL